MTKDISALRKEIDKLDLDLLEIISRRVKTASKIGKIKKVNKIPIIDPERKKRVLEKWINILEKNGISASDAKDLYNLIHKLSIKIERNAK
jgi:chorismate mutase